MSAFRVTFRPPWWATLLVIIACVSFLRAGFWQLERREEKAALFASFDAGGQTLLPVDALGASLSAGQRYRSVRLEGRYDAGHQVLLDNITRDGRAGYEVLTPFRTAGGLVLVNRGWLAAPADRSELPVLGVAESRRSVSGRLDRLPRPGLRLGAPTPEEAGAAWPRRLLYPDAATLAAQIGEPVPDYQLLLDPGMADGFLRDWRPRVSGPDMHLTYAVQWFAFAATALIIYVVLNAGRRVRQDD